MFIIQRKSGKGKNAKWVNKAEVDAPTANKAMRKYGLCGAFASPRVKVVTSNTRGVQYRAVRKGNS